MKSSVSALSWYCVKGGLCFRTFAEERFTAIISKSPPGQIYLYPSEHSIDVEQRFAESSSELVVPYWEIPFHVQNGSWFA